MSRRASSRRLAALRTGVAIPAVNAAALAAAKATSGLDNVVLSAGDVALRAIGVALAPTKAFV